MTDKTKPDLVIYDGVPLTEGQIMMLEDGCPREMLVPATVRTEKLKDVQPKETDMAKAGPKELQVRALRETAPIKKTKPAPAPAAAQPQPETPAPTPKETTVKTGTGKQKTRKGGPKQASAKKAPTTTRRQKPARSASAARAAAKDKNFTVRPGSKLEIIVGLLRRPEGCTTKQALAATNWPALSFNQQAKAAGLKLTKEKVDGVFVYRAS